MLKKIVVMITSSILFLLLLACQEVESVQELEEEKPPAEEIEQESGEEIDSNKNNVDENEEEIDLEEELDQGNTTDKEEETGIEEDIMDEEPTEQEGQKEEIEEESKVEEDVVVIEDPMSTDFVVNKQRKLPDGFVPDNLIEPNVPFTFAEWHEKRQMREVAALALEELFKAAEQDGLDLLAVSGYRSYHTQKIIYNHNVETRGQEHADKYSAKPGHSEHQTGLTMDVTAAVMASSPDVLVEGFRDTSEGGWLAEHAHEFGFIIRYPKGKEEITGYHYEPWHIRYVGEEIATEIYEQQITLEEYFGYYP